MIKDAKNIIGYLNEDELNTYKDSLFTYCNFYDYIKTKLGPTDFFKVNMIDFLDLMSQCGAGGMSKLNFICLEPGDVIKVSCYKDFIYGSYTISNKIKFEGGLKLSFTVTSIDKVNLRMEGFIDNNYFVTGIYYTDFNYNKYLGHIGSDQLAAYVDGINKLRLQINGDNDFDICRFTPYQFKVSDSYYEFM